MFVSLMKVGRSCVKAYPDTQSVIVSTVPLWSQRRATAELFYLDQSRRWRCGKINDLQVGRAAEGVPLAKKLGTGSVI